MAIELIGRRPNHRAIMQWAKAAQTFLEIGWKKSDLDMLETLWWKVHDDNGKIFAEAPHVEQR